jgi:hypothetical protein
MTPEQARTGMRVRVMEHHRVQERRGLLGTVVARYGGEDYVAVDVRLADGQLRLFWPRDLEEISPVRHGGASRSVGFCSLAQAPYSPKCVEGEFCELRVDKVPRSSDKPCRAGFLLLACPGKEAQLL